MRSHEQVLIGNGSRLAAVTVDSLDARGLIEVAGKELDPNPLHWYNKVIFFQLTEQGRNEVIRSHPRFVPEEVMLTLPYRVALLLQEVERYQRQHGCEPEVAIRGVLLCAYPHWERVRLSTWRCVAAYNEAENLLGLPGGETGSDEGTLLWVRPAARGWSLSCSARLRLRPTPLSEP